MTKLNQVYKCNVCGNIVEVVHEAIGELVCCGKPMELKTENTEDAAEEKHVPIIKKTDEGFKVIVGEVSHPMDEDHYIEWIEIVTPQKVYRRNLKPGIAPTAEFCVKAESVIVRAYCNLHGLWQSKN